MHRTQSLKRIFTAVALTVAMALGAVSPAPAFLDKTRFLAHIGVAYFVFHHWVMNPYHQGSFAQGAPHRTAALVKGGVALLFAVHEVRVAEKIAHNSKDPLLQKLDAGVAGLTTSFMSIGQRMKSGQFSSQDADTLTSQTDSVSSQAAAGGAKIKDVPVAVPGT
jgi:hypothetical protein